MPASDVEKVKCWCTLVEANKKVVCVLWLNLLITIFFSKREAVVPINNRPIVELTTNSEEVTALIDKVSFGMLLKELITKVIYFI